MSQNWKKFFVTSVFRLHLVSKILFYTFLLVRKSTHNRGLDIRLQRSDYNMDARQCMVIYR